MDFTLTLVWPLHMFLGFLLVRGQLRCWLRIPPELWLNPIPKKSPDPRLELVLRGRDPKNVDLSTWMETGESSSHRERESSDKAGQELCASLAPRGRADSSNRKQRAQGLMRDMRKRPSQCPIQILLGPFHHFCASPSWLHYAFP